jgi:hypothetical protein
MTAEEVAWRSTSTAVQDRGQSVAPTVMVLPMPQPADASEGAREGPHLKRWFSAAWATLVSARDHRQPSHARGQPPRRRRWHCATGATMTVARSDVRLVVSPRSTPCRGVPASGEVSWAVSTCVSRLEAILQAVERSAHGMPRGGNSRSCSNRRRRNTNAPASLNLCVLQP